MASIWIIKRSSEWLQEHAKVKDLLEALWEVLIVYIVSNIPFIYTILYHIFTTPGAEFSLDEAWLVIQSNVKAGEVLVYLAAIFGPIVYFYLRNIRAAKHYRWLALYLLGPFVFFLFVTPLFLADRSTESLNQPLISDTALYTYVVGLVFWYMALVYQKRILRDPYKGEESGAEHILGELRRSDS